MEEGRKIQKRLWKVEKLIARFLIRKKYWNYKHLIMDWNWNSHECQTTLSCNTNGEQFGRKLCLTGLHLCDDHKDCPNGEDETRYCGNKCEEDAHHCRDSDMCIPQEAVCDGEPQCPFADDEVDCNGELYDNKTRQSDMNEKMTKMLPLPSTSKMEEVDRVVLDALPYIDDVNYTEEHRQLAMKLIEAEMRKFPMTKNYLKNFPEPDYDKFLTPRLLDVQHKMANGEEIPKAMDLSRYDVPNPGRAANKKVWLNAIDNCTAQLGNQALRKINLELLDEFGPQAYLSSNERLKGQVENEEAELYKTRTKLYELNSRRKRTQLEAGQKFTALGEAWVESVTKNAGMQIAIDGLEAEIRAMAKRLKVEPGLKQKE